MFYIFSLYFLCVAFSIAVYGHELNIFRTIFYFSTIAECIWIDDWTTDKRYLCSKQYSFPISPAANADFNTINYYL